MKRPRHHAPPWPAPSPSRRSTTPVLVSSSSATPHSCCAHCLCARQASRDASGELGGRRAPRPVVPSAALVYTDHARPGPIQATRTALAVVTGSPDDTRLPGPCRGREHALHARLPAAPRGVADVTFVEVRDPFLCAHYNLSITSSANCRAPAVRDDGPGLHPGAGGRVPLRLRQVPPALARTRPTSRAQNCSTWGVGRSSTLDTVP